MEENGQNAESNGSINPKKDVKNSSTVLAISVENESCDHKMADRCQTTQNGDSIEVSRDLLGVARREQRKSFMEEESAKERTRLSLLKQCSAILKQGDGKYTKETLHRTFQDEDLLERIFRLFDVDKKQYLVQEDWIEYLKGRLTEEKQLDFVEQVESVAYVLVGSGDICLQTFKQILQNKVVTNKLLRVLDTDGDGCASADEIMEFLSAVSSSRPRVGFDKHSVDQLEQLFRQTVGDQREITREQFRKILVSKNPFFTERVFQIFDEDDSGAISLQEFIAAVHRFAGQTPDDKIRFLFEVYDLDGDGLIQPRELQHVMRACMEENGMSFSDAQLLELTSAMFEDADADHRGAITIDALRDQLLKHDGLRENLSISIDRWLVPPKPQPRPSFVQRLRKLKPYQLSLPYFKNNYVLVSYLVVFFLLNLGLFVSRAIEYRRSNGFVIFARACGQCLNFTCSWILVLMLRRSITWLRERGLSAVLPLDHHIYLHKLTGVLVAAYSALHTLMHLCNFSLIVVNDPELNEAEWSTLEWILTSRPGLFGLVPGWANPTGVVLVVLLVVICVCSRPQVRRGGCFEVFYWTHLLYVPFWTLLILHAPNFWKWFILPGSLYIAERILRLIWMRSGRGHTYIASGILLPSRVTHLVVRRPPHFSFRAGDYVFVNVPAIASYEWHPFTISSAPEQTEYLWLHVRGVGEWTNRLYEYFEEEHERLQGPSTPHRKASRTSSSQSKRKSSSGNGKKKSVDFSPAAYSNDAFSLDERGGEALKVFSPAVRTSLFLTPQRLEKSRSMPDVMNNQKRRQRLMALRDYMRSESEHSFDTESLRVANSPAYRSPSLRAPAHSFRYLRTKPAAVPLPAPAPRRLSRSLSPNKDIEAAPALEENLPPPDYPMGKPLEIYLDGPYGAASSRMLGAQHAALVAAGIGVTPFASVLQALMWRHRASMHTCPKCAHSFITPSAMHHSLRKVDFFWINREQRSFEWFVSLLSQLEMEQAEEGGDRFLEMHMYITSALQRCDMKAVGLQLALDLLHEREKRDLITGLKTRTNAGRPNWDKVFKQLQDQNKGKITVFYCGPPQLGRILRVKCDQFGFNFCKEVF
ncbi:hypothetical protein ACJJTC_007233 [Scirpophaga incertulas]